MNQERWESVKQLLIASRTARSMPSPEGSTLQMQTQLWLDALDAANVPTNRFRSLLAQCLASREWTGPVGVDAICKQWRQEQASQPRQTLQELDRETGRDLKALPSPQTDSAARTAFLLLGERMKAGKGNVSCECDKAAILSYSGAQWQCADSLCSFSWPTKDTMNAPHANAAGPLAEGLGGEKRQAESTLSESTLNVPREAEPAQGESTPEPMSDAALLDALSERCGMALGKTSNETAVAFGRHLLKVAPLDLWTRQIAAREWREFQAVAA